jgi:acetyl-CoA carboxylase biotin carboxyl carrier protein
MPENKSSSAIDLLQQVCEIMEDRDLMEVYLHEGEITLKVRRDGNFVPSSFLHQTNAVSSSEIQQTESSVSSSAVQLPQEAGEIIRSPMPGLFYQSPSPEEPLYVEVGTVVSEEDTLCLIEAMKIFNPVTPGFPCEILEILVENATAVEFDQPLFRVKPI